MGDAGRKQLRKRCKATNRRTGRQTFDIWTLLIIGSAAALAVHAAAYQSVTHDESAHVPAGLAYWQFGAFDVYPHNPPLVKMCLSLPLFASGVRLERAWLIRHPGPRYEWLLGQEFLRAHYSGADRVFLRCRLVSVAFFLWGGWLVVTWSRELFGQVAGRVGAVLWSLQPLVLAHASLATPDLGAAVLGLAAVRTMIRHAKAPTLWTATVAGVMLGLAQIAKYTLLILYVVWAAVGLVSLCCIPKAPVSRSRRLASLLYVPLISTTVICGGYGFVGVGGPLSECTFLSRRFSSLKSAILSCPLIAARVPLPLPRDYIEGIDRQWADVEHGWTNYLHGSLSSRGWWYYYLLAAAMKTPVPFWGLVVMAACAGWRGARADPQDEAGLLAAPLLVGGLLEANTSLTFLRYLLPAVPFVCVSVSRIASPVNWSAGVRPLALALLVPTVLLPVLQHPGYLGYFNLVAGGPAGAWPWFSDGEIDWGQDLPALRRWQRAHPEARPIRLALFSPFSPPYPGLIDDTGETAPETTLQVAVGAARRIPRAPQPGYLAVSVTLLNRIAAIDRIPERHAPECRFCRWLKARPPVALVGSSILIFYVSSDDVSQWDKQAVE